MGLWDEAEQKFSQGAGFLSLVFLQSVSLFETIFLSVENGWERRQTPTAVCFCTKRRFYSRHQQNLKSSRSRFYTITSQKQYKKQSRRGLDVSLRIDWGRFQLFAPSPSRCCPDPPEHSRPRFISVGAVIGRSSHLRLLQISDTSFLFLLFYPLWRTDVILWFCVWVKQYILFMYVCRLIFSRSLTLYKIQSPCSWE